MKRLKILLILLIFVPAAANAGQYHKKVRPTRNLIFMISDGTSSGVLSAARWYQIYNKLGGDKLAIDPYLCGMVKTYSSNSPIPDSSAAMSAYMTGQPHRAGSLCVYPPADPAQDIIEVDPGNAYQPLVTLMEAAKYEQGKAIGLVVTVNFYHATPAACVSHASGRSERDYIIPQIAHLGPDVVFGGGGDNVTETTKEYLRENGTVYFDRDITGFRNYNGGGKVWSVFAPRYMSYDIDRDDTKEPSLAEMTRKAIGLLSGKKNGFFLLVEGSKVDMAAHAGDPGTTITDFLAFDKAVAEVIEFAKKDGNTTVVICSDHGTGGFGFGDRKYEHYSTKGLDSVFMNVSQYQKSASELENILLKTKPDAMKGEFKKYTGIDLTDAETDLLLSSKNYKEEDYMKVSNSVNMLSSITKIMLSRTHFAFMSGSHTGEDVFLAAYHPRGDIPSGLNTSTELNRYMFDALGLKKSLTRHTEELFVRHDRLFSGSICDVNKENKSAPVLTVVKGGRTMEVPANGRWAYVDGKKVDLGSVAIYISANGMFYLPKSAAGLLE